MATALFPSFAEHYGAQIPTAIMERIGQSCERYAEMLDFVTVVGEPTFTHTDCRAENYLFGRDGDDSVTTVVDFQLSTRHIGMWDVTNLIAGSMETDVRREHETSLLRHYVDLVTAAGIDYSMEQARYEYRVCLLQQCPRPGDHERPPGRQRTRCRVARTTPSASAPRRDRQRRSRAPRTILNRSTEPQRSAAISE